MYTRCAVTTQRRYGGTAPCRRPLVLKMGQRKDHIFLNEKLFESFKILRLLPVVKITIKIYADRL